MGYCPGKRPCHKDWNADLDRGEGTSKPTDYYKRRPGHSPDFKRTLLFDAFYFSGQFLDACILDV